MSAFPTVKIRSLRNGGTQIDGYRDDLAALDVMTLSLIDTATGLPPTGVTSYSWAITGRMEGSGTGAGPEPISLGTASTAAFTVDNDLGSFKRNGTYLITCLVNGGSTTATRITAALVRLTGLTVPAAGGGTLPLRKLGGFESQEADTATIVQGWQKDLNRWLSLVEILATGGVPTGQTLAQTYATGIVAGDQTMFLLATKGGGIVIDGTDASVSADDPLTIKAPSAHGLVVRNSAGTEQVAIHSQDVHVKSIAALTDTPAVGSGALYSKMVSGAAQLFWHDDGANEYMITPVMPLNAEYVLIAPDAGLPQSRTLTAGNRLSFVDGGAGSTITENVVLSTGISGGDTLAGGTGATQNLTFTSTAHATKGKIIFGTSQYDEAINRLQIGNLLGAAPDLAVAHSSEVSHQYTLTDNSAYYGMVIDVDAQPSLNSGANLRGIDVVVRPTASATHTFSGQLTGGFFMGRHDGTGLVVNMTAVGGQILTNGIGQITNAIGGDFSVISSVGAVSTAYGVKSFVQATNFGSITTAYAVYASGVTDTTITNLAGVAIPSLLGGTNTTFLLVGTGTVPSGNWAIYSASTFPSLFSGSVVTASGALATNATTGFLYIPTSAGTPTGVAGAHTGTVAFEYDTTNDLAYVYNGGWKAISTGISAPASAEFLTLALNGTLTQERVFTPSDRLFGSDGGANSTYTLQVVLSNGIAGGDTLAGGSAASENLSLTSTAHATKGFIYVGATAGYNETTGNLGLGTNAPNASSRFHFVGDLSVASGTSAVLDNFLVDTTTITITGGAHITTAAGFNFVTIKQPTYQDLSAVTVDLASTVYIAGVPLAGEGVTFGTRYALFVNGDTKIAGKLTVTGAIDPTSLTLVDGSNAAYIEAAQGTSAAVSPANRGRIRYNATAQQWEMSANGAAYVAIGSGSGSAIQKTSGTGWQTATPGNVGGTFVQARGATGNAIYVAGITINPQSTATGIDSVLIGVGGSGSEVTVATIPIPAMDGGASGPDGVFIPLNAYVPVAAATRYAVRTVSGSQVQIQVLWADQTDIVTA